MRETGVIGWACGAATALVWLATLALLAAASLWLAATIRDGLRSLSIAQSASLALSRVAVRTAASATALGLLWLGFTLARRSR